MAIVDPVSMVDTTQEALPDAYTIVTGPRLDAETSASSEMLTESSPLNDAAVDYSDWKDRSPREFFEHGPWTFEDQEQGV